MNSLEKTFLEQANKSGIIMTEYISTIGVYHKDPIHMNTLFTMIRDTYFFNYKIISNIHKLKSLQITYSYTKILSVLTKKIINTLEPNALNKLIEIYNYASKIEYFEELITKQKREIFSYINTKLHWNIKMYRILLPYINLISENEKSPDNNKYQLMIKYLNVFPLDKKSVDELFVFNKNDNYNKTKFLFFAKRAELLVLEEYKKLYRCIAHLKPIEQHNIRLFMYDSSRELTENIGNELFSDEYYFGSHLSLDCKKFLE